MGVKNKKPGFTLIEMMIVIAIIGMILPVLFNIVFTVLRQQVRIQALQEIKRQGDSIMNSFETTLRNRANGIYTDQVFSMQMCSTGNSSYSGGGGTNFYIKDKDSLWLRFYKNTADPNDIYIASDSAKGLIRLNNPNVQVTLFSISCKRTATYSPAIISIKFTLTHKEGSRMTFQTRIKLRNY